MEQQDDIDILLTLNPHGWSTCLFFIKEKTVEYSITHIFGDPYFDLMKAISDLIKGEESATFFWYGEPGGEKIEMTKIKDQQHKIIVTSESFDGDFYEEPKAFELTVKFEIKLKQIVTLFYFQLKKTYTLLKDRQFAENRANDFPFQEFQNFERLVLSYFAG